MREPVDLFENGSFRIDIISFLIVPLSRAYRLTGDGSEKRNIRRIYAQTIAAIPAEQNSQFHPCPNGLKLVLQLQPVNKRAQNQ